MRNLLSILFILSLFQLPGCARSAPSVPFDIPIFAYHRFGDNRYPSTNTKLEVFEKQLKYLKDNHFDVITFGQAIDRWKSNKEMPEKTAILTIDDGYLSFYENGWPLLKKYGFPATIFIQTETVGGSDFMTWKQIREIQIAGIEIGNHSHSHAYFLNQPDADRKNFFENDLEKASQLFQKHLGKPPKIYAYPYGEYTTGTESVLKEKGFKAAAVQHSGVFYEKSDPFAIPRFPMGGAFGTDQGFIGKLEMKALPVSGTKPASPFYTQDPPRVKIEIEPGQIDLTKAQFFLKGEKMPITEINTDSNPPYVVLESSHKLTGRRNNYTLTAPSEEGDWHWFSYLWVNPNLKE